MRRVHFEFIFFHLNLLGNSCKISTFLWGGSVLRRKDEGLHQRIVDLEHQVAAGEENLRQIEAAAKGTVDESEQWLALAMSAAQLGAFNYYPQTGKLILSDASKRHFVLSPDAEVSYETL